MTETNPNYVPVDWASSPHPDDPRSELGNDGLTDEERDAGVSPLFGPPVIIDSGSTVYEEEVDYCPRCGGQNGKHEEACPMRETATLNSAGDPIKVGDRVHHIADVGAEKRSVGVVTYVGPVKIQGSPVDNGARCRWDGGEKEESHHVDQLTVLL